MAPYEALYGRKCRTPLCWTEVDDRGFLGPDIVQETTLKIKSIRDKLKVAQSRQKSYADRKRRPLEFQEGDHVFLRVTPKLGLRGVFKTKKLCPRYIGPYQILRRVGPVAYQLALPPSMSGLHDVFHVSQLRKCNNPFFKGLKRQYIIFFSFSTNTQSAHRIFFNEPAFKYAKELITIRCFDKQSVFLNNYSPSLSIQILTTKQVRKPYANQEARCTKHTGA
ncbi:hypothetical protein QL285_075386 [Trifolium repens]|nr:hypothetical protein QL285_075386 [Trifolium repens]